MLDSSSGMERITKQQQQLGGIIIFLLSAGCEVRHRKSLSGPETDRRKKKRLAVF